MEIIWKFDFEPVVGDTFRIDHIEICQPSEHHPWVVAVHCQNRKLTHEPDCHCASCEDR